MKDYKSEQIRNVVLLGHRGSGKTSVVEATLHYTKQTDRLGKTVDGTSAMDYDPEDVYLVSLLGDKSVIQRQVGLCSSKSCEDAETQEASCSLQQVLLGAAPAQAQGLIAVPRGLTGERVSTLSAAAIRGVHPVH